MKTETLNILTPGARAGTTATLTSSVKNLKLHQRQRQRRVSETISTYYSSKELNELRADLMDRPSKMLSQDGAFCRAIRCCSMLFLRPQCSVLPYAHRDHEDH